MIETTDMKMKTKIFIFGLDNAGKTEISKYLEAIAPSLDFSSPNLLDNELWEIHKIRFDMWKESGQESFRKIWLRGIELADLLLFILDTADKERYQEAKDEFEQFLQELPSNNAPILVHFHKMDLIDAQSNYALAESIFRELNLGHHTRVNFLTSIKDSISFDQSISHINRISQNQKITVGYEIEEIITS